MFAFYGVFLDSYKTSTTDGLTLTHLTQEILIMHGLNLSTVRGQYYDGTVSIRGCYSEVQSRIKEENQLAPHFHCYAHILNWLYAIMKQYF